MTRSNSFISLTLSLALSLGASFAGAQQDARVVRSRTMQADLRFFAETDRPGETIRLRLFDDTAYTVVLDLLSADGYGGVWRGHVQGHEESSSVVFVLGNDTLTGTLRVDGRAFDVRTQAGTQIIEEIDGSEPEVGACATTDVEPLARQRVRRQQAPVANSHSDFDVLAVYTGAALDFYGSSEALVEAVRLSVAMTNTAFENSRIAASLHLVGARLVDYGESGDSNQDLTRFSDRDGFMDEVLDWRDEHGADFMMLIANGPATFCGKAYVGGGDCPTCAFGLVRPECMRGMTFTHELGHQMGLYHERDNPKTPGDPNSYRYGYSVPGVFHTVQSYSIAGESVIPHFSNPAVSYGGRPTGVDQSSPDSADAAGWINVDRERLAAFRPCRVDCGTKPRLVEITIKEKGRRDGDTFKVMLDDPDSKPLMRNKARKKKSVSFMIPEGEHTLWVLAGQWGKDGDRSEYKIKVKGSGWLAGGKHKAKGALRDDKTEGRAHPIMVGVG